MHVFLLAAQTLDGKIARHAGERSFDWTSPEDKQFYIDHIKLADAIVIGRASFSTFKRYPRQSRWLIYTSKPEEFVNPRPEVIRAEGTNEDPAELLRRLEREGCQNVAICGGSSIYKLFLQAGLVQTMFLTIEPVIFGAGVPLIDQPINSKLRLNQVHNLTQSVKVIEYTVLPPESQP